MCRIYLHLGKAELQKKDMYPYWSHTSYFWIRSRKGTYFNQRKRRWSSCTIHFNTVKGTYFRFWVIGIQLWWKDGQHGLAHFSHPRDQLGLDCIRILKRRHKHYWDWGCFQTGLLLPWVKTFNSTIPFLKPFLLKKQELFMIPNTIQMLCKYSTEEIMTRKMSVCAHSAQMQSL